MRYGIAEDRKRLRDAVVEWNQARHVAASAKHNFGMCSVVAGLSAADIEAHEKRHREAAQRVFAAEFALEKLAAEGVS